MTNPQDVITINATIKIQAGLLPPFENYIHSWFDVISFRIVPDTTKLYEEDKMFKKLVKLEKEARVAKEKYINLKN